jgi:hypothetical protein
LSHGTSPPHAVEGVLHRPVICPRPAAYFTRGIPRVHNDVGKVRRVTWAPGSAVKMSGRAQLNACSRAETPTPRSQITATAHARPARLSQSRMAPTEPPPWNPLTEVMGGDQTGSGRSRVTPVRPPRYRCAPAPGWPRRGFGDPALHPLCRHTRRIRLTWTGWPGGRRQAGLRRTPYTGPRVHDATRKRLRRRCSRRASAGRAYRSLRFSPRHGPSPAAPGSTPAC